MSRWEYLAVFFGASPVGTALLLSLILSLLLILLARTAFFLGPKLRHLLKDNPHIRQWTRRFPAISREWQLLLLGFAVLVCSVLGFATISEGLTETPYLRAWDQRFVLAAHEHIRTWEVTLFEITTVLGGRLVSILLGAGLTLWFLIQRNKRFLLLWAGGLIGNSIIIQILKHLYERPRPEFSSPLLTEANFSFPSGHAAASIVMYGLLAYLILIRRNKMKTPARLAVVTGVLWTGVFIGTSRLALGVHYPSDVLAGWLVAIAWLTVLVCVDQYVRATSMSRLDTPKGCLGR